MNQIVLKQLAEDVLTFAVADAQQAQSLAAVLRASGKWREVVAGLDSIAVQFDRQEWTAEAAKQLLSKQTIDAPDTPLKAGHVIEVPIHYGGQNGPDLVSVCEQLEIDEAAFVARHSDAIYYADMIGFMPGFAYLSGLHATLNVPRRASPRPRVRAGSVGISGQYCGLYALPGPGGWQLIGRTDMTLFDKDDVDPFIVNPGAKIRFVPQ